MIDKRDILISVKGLKTYFPIKKGLFRKTVGYVKAVDDVNLDIYKGEILGIVGESGCGKTTLGKSILQLIKPTAGAVFFERDNKAVEICSLSNRELDPIRKKMQIVFQDPYSSLNPAFTVFGSMEEPLIKFGIKGKAARRKKVAELLAAVNLPEEYMTRYPNEFSGGQRQRIGIARALSVDPEFIVCDEAVSALDVSIQAQVLQLLKELRDKRNLTYMFITHDLSVVEYLSDRIVVMYLGKVVELADTVELFANTLHPYTKALLSAIPIADIAKTKKRTPLQGDVPSPANPPSGCPFHPRCPKCQQTCKAEAPKLRKLDIEGTEHFIACHFPE
ncbi:MAG: ABC transporter ATP-binding protein [Angelakisella sp.]